ncbi:MAG: PIN domain-containing protein [Candidatus Diapherotrites archaeon]|nr:PIN domain-containing protein [Candidatus Diapherotrites archaeon]
MNLIVDANIVFAVLIKQGISEDLLFDEQFTIYAPEFLFIEFEKYKSFLLTKTHRTEIEFIHVLSTIRNHIVLVPSQELEPFLDPANLISPDPRDIPYIALAIKLNAVIWSNDRLLKEKLPSYVKVYTTQELLKL